MVVSMAPQRSSWCEDRAKYHYGARTPSYEETDMAGITLIGGERGEFCSIHQFISVVPILAVIAARSGNAPNLFTQTLSSHKQPRNGSKGKTCTVQTLIGM